MVVLQTLNPVQNQNVNEPRSLLSQFVSQLEKERLTGLESSSMSLKFNETGVDNKIILPITQKTGINLEGSDYINENDQEKFDHVDELYTCLKIITETGNNTNIDENRENQGPSKKHKSN